MLAFFPIFWEGLEKSFLTRNVDLNMQSILIKQCPPTLLLLKILMSQLLRKRYLNLDMLFIAIELDAFNLIPSKLCNTWFGESRLPKGRKPFSRNSAQQDVSFAHDFLVHIDILNVLYSRLTCQMPLEEKGAFITLFERSA